MAGADRRPTKPSLTRALKRSGIRRYRTRDRGEAERIITEVYLPHELRVAAGSSLDMALTTARFAHLTAGLLTYGSPVHLVTDEASAFLVSLTIRGQVSSRASTGETVHTTAGEAAIFGVETPLELTESANCLQLCIMAPRTRVEEQLERLLGRSVREPLRFEPRLSPEATRLVQPAFQLLAAELQTPSGLATQPTIARHIEGLLLDSILLAQPHNHLHALTEERSGDPDDAIARAADLIESRPADPWTVASLASAVHLSVRTLHYGFRREYGTTPMAYLRDLRLRLTHAALLTSSAGRTSVREVAAQYGFQHMGRFAGVYRERYGETPSMTLARGSVRSRAPERTGPGG